jgi:hypothetical protein
MEDAGLTVAVTVAIQPVGSVYDIAVVPDAMPYTMPEMLPIVAIDVLLLLHLPPLVASVRVELLPWHKAVVPLIAAGEGFTETVAVTVHPLAV